MNEYEEQIKKYKKYGIVLVVSLAVIISYSVWINPIVFRFLEPNTDDGNTNGNSSNNDDNPQQTEYALQYDVNTIDGNTISLSDYQGKTLILYFTSVHCEPCKLDLPYLTSAYNTYKNTGNVEFISIDIGGSSTSQIEEWREDNDITWNVCSGTGTLANHFSIAYTPTYIILDEDGNEIDRKIGAIGNEQSILDLFES
ncbi:MAG: TlpA family protein disulfide reductase [Promethearchaeota archaeon]